MFSQDQTPVFTLILIVANLVFSLIGFSQPGFVQRFSFQVGAIKKGEWWRMITGNFLHGDISHLFFNLYSFYIFGDFIERIWGGPIMLAIYFGAMFGGDLLALVVHRNHPAYSSIGASGAVAGIIFAFIMVNPMSMLLLFFILPIPAFVFGILYVAYSLYGIPKRLHNIGHEAHLGGAIIGAILGFLLLPLLPFFISVEMVDRIWLLGVLVVPSIVVLYLYIARPDTLRIVNEFSIRGKAMQKRRQAHDRHYNPDRERRAELDQLLDKISRKGMDSLSDAEKRRLKELTDLLG